MGEGVMTDHQIEDLRLQIAAYATICEQLVAMHKVLGGAHHDSLSGLRMGSIYYHRSTTSKTTGRQRWTPTPSQLQILESIFDQGTGAPSKQKIKEITQKLSHHGEISESNVYNWFQNRRARSKRKQTATVQINTDSEAGADLASPNEKMARVKSHEKLPLRLDNLHCPCSETSSEVSSTDQETNRAQSISMLNDISNSCQMSFYENLCETQETFSRSFSAFQSAESYL